MIYSKKMVNELEKCYEEVEDSISALFGEELP
jgi:hypothetical protein